MRHLAGVGERIHLRKSRTRQFTIFAEGRVGVKKFRRGECEPYETRLVRNAITAAGFDVFLKLVAGTSGAHFSSAFSGLDVGDQEFFPASVGPSGITPTKPAPSYAVRWEFHDDTTNVYTPGIASLYNGDPGSPNNPNETTEDGSVITQFNSVDISAFGQKPSTENWHYIVDLEIYSTDTDFDSQGLNRMMNAFVSNTIGWHFTGSNVLFHPVNGSDVELAGVDLAADGNPFVDTANNKLVWVWTVPDGTFNGTWVKTKIKHNLGGSKANLRFGGCKQDGSSYGTKGAGEEWEYTYEFLISQGA